MSRVPSGESLHPGSSKASKHQANTQAKQGRDALARTVFVC